MVRRTMARNAFGGPISDQGVVRTWIAESRMEIEQARLLVLKTAWMIDRVGAKGAQIEIAAVKVIGPRVARSVLNRAIQCHGGGGVTDDFPIARSGRAHASSASPTGRTRYTSGASRGRSAEVQVGIHGPVAAPTKGVSATDRDRPYGSIETSQEDVDDGHDEVATSDRTAASPRWVRRSTRTLRDVPISDVVREWARQMPDHPRS